MQPVPKKRLGQHFLTDRHYIERIVNAIAPKAGELMVEIGPGPGAITEPLIAALGHLHVVEIDRALAATLRERFDDMQITVHNSDALEFDFALIGAQPGARFRVAGNLPYNISTPLLFHLANYAEQMIDGVFMLQKEVVDRMVAAPDTDAYGRLSVMLQYRFAMKRLFEVPPGAFYPPPKVDSAIVRMVPLLANRPRAHSDKRLAEIVTAGFGQRRKTLSNTLKPFMPVSTIEAQGIDPKRRAETLSLAEFMRLSDASEAQNK